MVQSNSIADAFQTAFSLPPLLIGVLISALAAFVFFGGMGRIAAFTEKIVPIMAALYLIGGLIVLFANASNIIPAFKMIFVGAFDPAAATGGIIGAGVKEACATAWRAACSPTRRAWAPPHTPMPSPK